MTPEEARQEVRGIIDRLKLTAGEDALATVVDELHKMQKASNTKLFTVSYLDEAEDLREDYNQKLPSVLIAISLFEEGSITNLAISSQEGVV